MPLHPSSSLILHLRDSRLQSPQLPLLQSHIILSLATKEPKICHPNYLNHLRSIPELLLSSHSVSDNTIISSIWTQIHMRGNKWNSSQTAWDTSISSASRLYPPPRSRMVMVSFMLGHKESLYKATWILTYLACNQCPQTCGLLGMSITWLSPTVTFTEHCRNAWQTSGFSYTHQAVQEVWEDIFDSGFLQKVERKGGKQGETRVSAHFLGSSANSPRFVFTCWQEPWSRKGIQLWHEGCCAKLCCAACVSKSPLQTRGCLQELFFLFKSY